MKMKNKLVFVAMLAMILAFGITVVGCDNNPDNNDDNNNNNNGTDVVPADLRGIWTVTASREGISISVTYTFTANTQVATINGVNGGETVSGTVRYTVTACSPATNNDNATKVEFPSGYTLTLLVTAMEGDSSLILSGSGLKVGDTISPTFYLNTAKNKLTYVNNMVGILTKQ